MLMHYVPEVKGIEEVGGQESDGDQDTKLEFIPDGVGESSPQHVHSDSCKH